MAIRVELPKEILNAALEQAITLRARHITAATNAIIKQALEQEQAALIAAKSTIQEVK